MCNSVRVPDPLRGVGVGSSTLSYLHALFLHLHTSVHTIGFLLFAAIVKDFSQLKKKEVFT